MAKMFKAGDELRDKSGNLLLTFALDYTAKAGMPLPSSAHVLLPSGEHPRVGEPISADVMRELEVAVHG